VKIRFPAHSLGLAVFEFYRISRRFKVNEDDRQGHGSLGLGTASPAAVGKSPRKLIHRTRPEGGVRA